MDAYVRREDLKPTRWTIVLARVLEAERHSFLIYLPPCNGIPLKFNDLRFQSAVLLRRVQLERRCSYRGDDVPFLPRVAGTVREHDVAVTAQLFRQL